MRTLATLAALLGAVRGAPVEFNRDVRPILSDKCFACHGPDAPAKNIRLRLDQEASAKGDLGGRRAIVEGDPAASELIRRVTHSSKGLRMPPAHTGLQVTGQELATLRAWIEQGARWQPHWSFLPPKRPDPPAVRNAAWARNPIDRFVLARLEREGLAPAPEAARETLLRRVTLDLTGLPPTPAEIDAFLADTAPDAFERVVDRLLASPRYGERMAIRWLEAARYADSNGYQFDGERVMWRWRDWVIDAFNSNQPYDRFVLEQIAGDMLPGATPRQIIATGFNRNHRGNTEDGIVPEEYAVEYVVDRVETTGTVFLGLTLGCARCHNHKYDPFTQKEFYQLFAYFNNVPEHGRAMKYGNSPPLIPAPTEEQQAELRRQEQQITAVQQFLEERSSRIARDQKAWEESLASAPPSWWTPAARLDLAVPFDGAVEGQAIGTISFVPGKLGQAAAFDGTAYVDAGAAKGQFDIDEAVTISAWVRSSAMDGPILTKMQDSPRGRGYGLHLDRGKVHVHWTSVYETDAIRMESERTLEPDRWHHLLVTYSGSRMAEGIRVYHNGSPLAMKVLQENLYRPFRNAGHKFSEALRIGSGWGKDRRFRGLLDDVRVWGRMLRADEIAALALGEPVNVLARQPAERRTVAQNNAVRWQFLEHGADPETRQGWARLEELRLRKEQFEGSFPTVMVMAESPQRKDTYVLQRGAYDKPGEKVEPGLPAVLPPLPAGAPNNRLGFALWLIDPAHPLTARVAVNRFWQMYFGAGLVKTPEDFGLQGDWPSHPELLDWLAVQFVASGWDVKAMQKLIVTSATYRQSSRAAPAVLQRDPENRLLARGPRLRLSAEMVRDQALFVAGLLHERIGGPSVKPYQPEGLWKEITMQDNDYQQSTGPDLYRRGLYTYWKRSVAPPMMVHFDAAMRESCVVRESRTNTPLQALNLMNDVTFVEAARLLGQRMLQEGGSTASSRLRFGFRLVTGRWPDARELAILEDSLAFHLDYFAGDPRRVAEYLSHGDSRPDAALEGRQLAAYGSVGSLLLNLDEAITKE